MDRCKSTARKKLRQGESQKRERGDREKGIREKMRVREKVGKLETLCFSDELWREAYWQVKC